MPLTLVPRSRTTATMGVKSRKTDLQDSSGQVQCHKGEDLLSTSKSAHLMLRGRVDSKLKFNMFGKSQNAGKCRHFCPAWSRVASRSRFEPTSDLTANNLVIVAVEARELRPGGQKASAVWGHHLGRPREIRGFDSASILRLLDAWDFEWRDIEPEWPSAVIVNQSLVRRYFPAKIPLGRCFFHIGSGNV